MTDRPRIFAPALVALSLVGAPLGAETYSDFALTYLARDNVGGADNDIIRGTAGLTLAAPEGGLRFALGLGVRNERFKGDYPHDLQFSALRFYTLERGMAGAGLTLGTVEDGDSTADLAAFATRNGDRWTARGLIGLQGRTGDGVFDGGRNVSGYALAEITYYVLPNIGFRTSAAVDDIDLLGSVGVEVQAFDWPVTAYADWTLANRYRVDRYYNDLVFGISYTRGFGSLRDRDQTLPIRALSRPVDPQ